MVLYILLGVLALFAVGLFFLYKRNQSTTAFGTNNRDPESATINSETMLFTDLCRRTNEAGTSGLLWKSKTFAFTPSAPKHAKIKSKSTFFGLRDGFPSGWNFRHSSSSYFTAASHSSIYGET